MKSRLSVYTTPSHGDHWLQYTAKLQPYDVLIVNPDIQQVIDAHKAAPGAEVVIRRHDWDDGRSDSNPYGVYADLERDPVGLARRHVQQYTELIVGWEAEAKRRGAKLPPREQMPVHLVNEPDTNRVMAQINTYTIEAARGLYNVGIPVEALNLSTGHPAHLHSGKSDWRPLEGALDALIKYRGYAVIHEYWNSRGIKSPELNPWHVGRHHWAPAGPQYKIGEFGLEEILNGVLPDHHGWQGRVSADTYLGEVDHYMAHLRDDVVSARIFKTDHVDRRWRTFGTEPIADQLVALGRRYLYKGYTAPTQHSTPPVAPMPTQPVATVPPLTHPIQDPSFRIVSQIFGVNPEVYARFGLKGHNGIDFAVPTGLPICAVAPGDVAEVWNDPAGYGLYVKLIHPWGQTVYAHLSAQKVAVGTQVAAGDIVGFSGNTGFSTGPHLHLGIRVNPFTRGAPFDGYTDPAPYLAPTSQALWPLIQSAAKEVGLAPELLGSLAWAESSWRVNAKSPAGAMGLTQIMPSTWAEWAPRVGATDPYNAAQNLKVGAAYLAWCIRTAGSVRGGLGAYVWGIGNVKSGKTPPAEVLEYASKILHGHDLLIAVMGGK
jgi:hypothetical protein